MGHCADCKIASGATTKDTNKCERKKIEEGEEEGAPGPQTHAPNPHTGKKHSKAMYCLACDELECKLSIGSEDMSWFWSCCGQDSEVPFCKPNHTGKKHSKAMYCLACDELECKLSIGSEDISWFWSCCGQDSEVPFCKPNHTGKKHSKAMYCLACDELECKLSIGSEDMLWFWSCCGQDSEVPFCKPKGVFLCCNCAKERGWRKYDSHGCNQCKLRQPREEMDGAMQKQMQEMAVNNKEERDVDFKKAVEKAVEEEKARWEAAVREGKRSPEVDSHLQAGGGAGVEVIEFGELQLERQPMAHGSFKELYRAIWRRPGQEGVGERVAVLVMRGVGCIENEVAVMKKLGRHPHLCRLLGTTVKPPSGSQTMGSQGMVMEFADMGSLDVVLHNISESGADRPTDAVLLTVVDQVCEGMRMLSEHNIIHRDVAARNCLVFAFHPTMRRHVCVKVTDYGLAMDAAAGTAIMTKGSSQANPIRWMAPEAILQGRHSPQSDVYSFGVLMWEVFTLCSMIPLWRLRDDERIAESVVNEGARPERPDKCPDTVYAIMQNCWKNNKAERPTFAQLKFDLQDALVDIEGRARARSEDSDQSFCVVCLERPATHALLPCGHRCVCEEDTSHLRECPLCRAKVQSSNRIY